ncbi:MAG: helix-turn-helix domain-containing protein [Candidatus Atribacteria bacterium]|nr:helix-turn-helix domain-containing protein [Candidatus Atribacteria bacterium]
MKEDTLVGLGALLKKRREERGLTLQDVEQQTLIRKKQLAALEDEQWRELPGRSYAFGYLKNYGRLLGIDEQTLKEMFNRAYPDVEVPKIDIPKSQSRPTAKPVVKKKSPVKRILLLLIILAAVFTSLFITYNLSENGRENPPLNNTNVGSIGESLSPAVSGSPAAGSILNSASPLVTEVSPRPQKQYALGLVLVPEEVAWLHVSSETNQNIFSGVLVPQKEYSFQSNIPLDLTFLGGSKVKVRLNGSDAGYLAENDQRSERTFRP